MRTVDPAMCAAAPRRIRRGRGLSRAAVLACALVLLGGCHGGTDSQLAKARQLQEAGDQKSAVHVLQKFLDAHPDNAEANLRLGTALISLGRSSEAIFPLRNATSSDKFGHQAGLLLIAALIRTHNDPDAVAEAGQLLAKDPHDRQALVMRGQAAISDHDGKTALESAERLLALDPGNLSYRMLRAEALANISQRQGDAEQAYQELEKADWGKQQGAPGHVCIALGRLYKNEGKTDKATKQLEGCGKRYGDQSSVVLDAVATLDEMSRDKEAGAVLQSAYDAHPGKDALRSALAERLISNDHFDKAEALILKGAKDKKSAGSWSAVANVRRLAGDPKGALEAVNKGLAIAPDDDSLHFFKADLLAQLGQLDAAEAESKTLQADLYKNIIHGRLLLARGHPKPALKLFTEAEAQWPNNAGVRELAAQAALDLGDENRAISELREAERSMPQRTDAALDLAVLYFARGQYDYAHALAWQHIQNRGTASPAAHLLASRAALAAGKVKVAYADLQDLANRRNGEFAAAALAGRAELDLRLAGPEKAREKLLALLEANKLDLGDPKNGQLLRELCHLDELSGQSQRAIARVGKLIASHPESAALLALRGQLELHAGHTKQAGSDFDQALSLDPKQPYALAGQGIVLQDSGDLAQALKRFDQAAKLDPKVADFAYLGAKVVSAQGDAKGYRKRLEVLLRSQPDFAPACNDLAWMLAQDPHSLHKALVLAQRAVRLGGRAEMLDTLGYVQLQMGNVSRSVEIFKKAVARKPEYATARYHLGLALARQGDRDAAREALRAALAGGSFPEAAAARVELARLEGTGGSR